MTDPNPNAPIANIQEVFGQYAVEIAGQVLLYATEDEARTKLSEHENGEEQMQIAREYAEARGLAGKNAKGKINVVVDFLRWVDTGRPGVDLSAATDADPIVEPEAPDAGDEIIF